MEFSFIQELVHRLKTFQAMKADVVTAPADLSMREAQALMRGKKISGLPIVDNDKLLGMLTVEDLIRALDKGRMDDAVSEWMTMNVVTARGWRPLTETMSILDRTGYARLPVLSEEGKLIGLITSDSILHTLVVELDRLLGQDEERPPAEPVPPSANAQHWSYTVEAGDYDSAGLTSVRLKRELAAAGVPADVQRRAAIAVYEAEANLIIHTTKGGTINADLDGETLRLVVSDAGPGIEDVNLAMKAGWSTASDQVRGLGFGAGLGLPNIRKCADEFAIDSEPGRGTRLEILFHLAPKAEAQAA